MIRIAVPNKGRLSEETLDLFRRAGLPAQFRAERALMAGLGEGFQALFVRAEDIPEFVADGAADLGVTGSDLVEESGRELRELLDLGFGRCRLVLAVRDESPVGRAADLPAGTRIATSFPRIAGHFLRAQGVEATLVPVSGACEITPHIGVADGIVDLVSTGSTLRVNGLKELETLLESSARLVANGVVMRDPARSLRVGELVVALESVLRAERKRYLMANVPRDRLDEVREVIPGISGPTIVEVLDGGKWVAAHAVVDADRLFHTVNRLKALGAEGILVTRIERLMP